MKQCPNCREEFHDYFKCCPMDGTPLADLPPPRPEIAGLKLCIMEDEGLFQRLLANLKAVARDQKLTWPEFKKDPFGFSKRFIIAYATVIGHYFSKPTWLSAPWKRLGYGYFAIPLAGIVLFSVLIVVRDNRNAEKAALLAKQQEESADVTMLPGNMPTPDPGTAGMNKGKGGGSKPKQEKPGGGGGGGRENPKPASAGKLPQASLTVPQVVAPDTNPPKVKNPSLPTPATIDADPLLFPPDSRVLPYGDPKSKSTDPSNGPGTGGGIGNGTGGGVGPGTGGGVGPGNNGNTGGGDRNEGGGGPGGGGGGNTIYVGKQVTEKARLISKPEPQYTEEARKNQITGTVVLKVVFDKSGEVNHIVTMKGLPFGLTERAIAAAKKIKFVPAKKDGKDVSMWMQLEYNFNLY